MLGSIMGKYIEIIRRLLLLHATTDRASSLLSLLERQPVVGLSWLAPSATANEKRASVFTLVNTVALLSLAVARGASQGRRTTACRSRSGSLWLG